MKISVIIPSRLQENLNGQLEGVKTLWLDRAINSVFRQNVDEQLEVVVGLSPGHPDIPDRFGDGITFVTAPRPGQAAAVNAAVNASTGDVLAFLEDDDYWRSLDKLAIQLKYVGPQTGPVMRFDLVTSNQREVTFDGQFVRINDFATPSGWLMRRKTWDEVGGFDESFRYHVDTEWLGRASKKRVSRMHLVESGALFTSGRDWLVNISLKSSIMEHFEPDPLVERMVNPEGGMAAIASDSVAAAQSQAEHRIMMIHISEPTRLLSISYAVFCLKK